MSAINRAFEGRFAAALAGVVFVVTVLGLSTLGVAYGFGVFSHTTTVTAVLPQAGPALGPGSEVQYRGVLVGTLGKLDRTQHDAILTMDIQPSKVHQIPADVTVRLVPRSVFGDLYVDLVPPTSPFATGQLHAGAQLAADTTTPSVELDQALDAGYELLTAVQPATLDATLTAIATAVNGRGAKLGALVNQAAQYTAQVAPHTAQLIHDMTALGAISREVATDAPNLLRTVDDGIAISQTVAADQPTLVKVLSAGVGVADQTSDLLNQNRTKLVSVVNLLHPVIGVLGQHRPDLVRTVTQLRAFLLGAASALGHGPYLQVAVTLNTNASDGVPYSAADCPRYPGLAGRNCVTGAKADNEAGITALVASESGAGKTSSTSPSALAALQQRIAIGDVLLAPVLRSVGGLLK